MVNPAGLEVYRHRISSVAEAMGATLQRAAYSPNIKERRDFSCAVFDRRGRLLAQAAHIPVHLGAMPAAVDAVRRRVRQWSRGDVIALNDPYQGGSHLPDITTVSPVFAGEGTEPALFVATRAHHADVGGAAPGSLPLVRDLLAEGIVLPPVRLARKGRLVADLVAILCANSRTPEDRRGDLEAQLAAHRTGTRRLEELLAHDAGAFARAGDALLAYSERLTRTRLKSLPDGIYAFEDALDGDGLREQPLAVRVRVLVDEGTLTADFTGSAPQAPGGVNAPLAVTASAVFYVVVCLVGDVPINAGTFAPVEVIAPRGSLLNPRPPAAVAGGNVETSQRIVDVLLGALAEAAPERIPAASQGTMNNVMIGGIDPRCGRPFSYYETIGGGAGAGEGVPGTSGIQVHMTNTLNTPTEALETAFPLRVEAYQLRRGSGGAGRFPGGDGLERRLRFRAAASVTLLTERRIGRPWGLAGGEPGAPGENLLHSQQGKARLPGKVAFDANPGDLLVIRTPGGGGWGSPTSERFRKSFHSAQAPPLLDGPD